MKKPNQRDIILWHLKNIGTLTRAQAMSEYGIVELPARIVELNEANNIQEEIESEAIKKFAERLKVEMIDKKYKYVTETNYSKTVNAVIDACIVATDTVAKEMTEGDVDG